jgi:thiol-disulfide isomerase/thioredoxin
MKRKILLFAGIALIFVGIGIYFGARQYQPATPDENATVNFYRHQLPDAQGTLQSLEQWKGRSLVVNFWATWCAPCVDEMPELNELQEELTATNTQILGIGIDSASNIADFGGKYGIHYPLYVAGVNGTERARQFGNQAGGLPYTVLIDKNGTVRKTYLGRLDMSELRKDIQALF